MPLPIRSPKLNRLIEFSLAAIDGILIGNVIILLFLWGTESMRLSLSPAIAFSFGLVTVTILHGGLLREVQKNLQKVDELLEEMHKNKDGIIITKLAFQMICKETAERQGKKEEEIGNYFLTRASAIHRECKKEEAIKYFNSNDNPPEIPKVFR